MTSERVSSQPEEATAEASLANETRPIEKTSPPKEVYSDDEAEVIAERLAALGYLE